MIAAAAAFFAELATRVTVAALASSVAPAPPMSPAERAYAKTVTPMTANDVTANLRGVVGKRVRFVCDITSIVDKGSLIGQCGTDAEPVDLYVHTPTAGLRIGGRIRVLGEMETPSMWVDVTGHPWYTPFVRARFTDPLR